MRAAACSVLLVALASSACSSSSGGSSGPPDGPEACGRFFDTTFGKVGYSTNTVGSGSSSPGFSPAILGMPSGCDIPIDDALRAKVRARFVDFCVSALDTPGSYLSTAFLDRCAAAVTSRPCGSIRALPDACTFSDYHGGVQKIGEPCDLDNPYGLQCELDGYCSYANDPNKGTCQPAVVPGGACAQGSGSTAPPNPVPCQYGYHCAPSNDSSNPYEGTCVANPPTSGATPGQPCDDEIGPRCSSPDTCVQGRCRGTGASGDTCKTTEDCADPLVCDSKGT